MSKNRRQQKKAAFKQKQQKAKRPAARLQLAEEAFHSGDMEQAVAAAELALCAGNDPNTERRAKSILAEALLRQAAPKPNQERLRLLDQALKHAPQEGRLYYHRGLALWRAGKVDEASKALAAAAQAKHPHTDYLVQLANVAAGKAVETKGFSPVQCATLTLLQQLQQGKTGEEALAKLQGKAPLGDLTDLWSVLLQMYDNENSVPAVTYAQAAQHKGILATNAVVTYYQGVLDMRQGNPNQAQASWRSADRYLNTPWVTENLHNFRRERATELAQANEWQAVIDLYEATLADVGAEEMDTVFNEIAGYAHFHSGFAAGQHGDWAQAYRHFSSADKLIKNRLLSQNFALAAEAMGSWGVAAEAWREMVRRRPRKESHPDYLSDSQVAAIWQRIGHCYLEEENMGEAVTCLKNAIKYAEADLDLRLQLAGLLMDEDRVDAAENELQRILEIDENYVPALMRLGMISTGRWDRDALPIWRRVLALEPNNEDARTALAMYYVEGAGIGGRGMFGFGRLTNFGKKTPIQVLEEGLAELPEHPFLLLALGRLYVEKKQKPQARDHLYRAAQAAPGDVMVLGVVLHELLHVDGDDQVRELIPRVRAVSGLRPGFWINQGEQVLECELNETWTTIFWDQAVASAQSRSGDDSPAATLLRIVDTAYNNDASELAKPYATQLRTHHPKSGAIEYMDALALVERDPEKSAPISKLLRKAKSMAQKASEPGIVELVEELENSIKFSAMNAMFGGRNPLAALFNDLDPDFDPDLDPDLDFDEEELLNAFRKFL
ncbi:MAG: tetratricopeptide repeat protein [Caldilineaceae bacterium]